MTVGLQALHNILIGGRQERRSEVALVDLDERTDALMTDRYKTLQYWPETLQDNKAVNWSAKEIPGGSLPVYQWVSSGERQISFTAVFTCDVDYGADLVKLGGARDGVVMSTRNLFSSFVGTLRDPSSTRYERLKAAGEEWRNPNIVAALVWLRSFMFPSYSPATQVASGVGAGDSLGGGQVSGIGASVTFAPRKLLLIIPGAGLGLLGGYSASVDLDRVRCIMVGCDITFNGYFPSGVPRAAEASLRFNQIAQFGDRVEFPSRGPEMDRMGYEAYRMPQRRQL